MKLAFPLDRFLQRAAEDVRLLPTHMTLFLAIFYYSSADDSEKSFRISRSQLMRYSRIKSKSTYHKCLMELVKFGFITYKPSFDPLKASMVRIITDCNPTQIV